ncbi:hypothetical protein BSL78_24414 [Apostichopus japonicus]|uniref:Uncharacterized protein n=1 Tax=Stichopus japonicus TaxID=307972 RepID=A0A2G8JSQ1_STIJA|nr:hypothetical protein BSL78_24414 [Apostichopus japonicus]
MADLEDSAVDALLASDADNSPNSPRDGNGSDRGHRRSSSVEESYGDSREDHRSSESAERDGRQSRRRASSQGEQTRYSLRSSNLNNADSTSNNLDGDISSGRDEEGDNDVTPVGSPTSPYSPTNTDDNSFEPTGSDGFPRLVGQGIPTHQRHFSTFLARPFLSSVKHSGADEQQQRQHLESLRRLGRNTETHLRVF